MMPANVLSLFTLKENARKLQFQSDPYFYTYMGLDLLELGALYELDLDKNRGLEKGGFSRNTYQVLKSSPFVHLCVLDIKGNKVLFQTHNAKENIEAASVSKVCASMAALDMHKGVLPEISDYEHMLRLLVCSNNKTWDRIQEIADGKLGVNSWALQKGFHMKPACVGPGNNLVNAYDMCYFWGAVLKGQYLGSELIFKLSSSCKTHDTRALKYMPGNCFLGGKTGTYKKANHDSCWVLYQGQFYAISVMTLLGNENEELSAIADEDVAILFRGLFDEYCTQ